MDSRPDKLKQVLHLVNNKSVLSYLLHQIRVQPTAVTRMRDLLRSLHDPILVARFQKLFGIEIIQKIEKNKTQKWLPVELREIHEREDVMGSVGTSINDYNVILYKVE